MKAKLLAATLMLICISHCAAEAQTAAGANNGAHKKNDLFAWWTTPKAASKTMTTTSTKKSTPLPTYVPPKKVSILTTARTIAEGESISPNDILLKQVDEGQVPPDACTTKTLLHPPFGLDNWQARYTLPEGTVISYYALGPGRYSCYNKHWTWHNESRQIARHFSSRSRSL